MIIVEMFETNTGPKSALTDSAWEMLEEEGWDCYPEDRRAELVCSDVGEAFRSFSFYTGHDPRSSYFEFYVGKDQVN